MTTVSAVNRGQFKTTYTVTNDGKSVVGYVVEHTTHSFIDHRNQVGLEADPALVERLDAAVTHYKAWAAQHEGGSR